MGLPIYEFAVRYFKHYLKIDKQVGSRYLRLQVLQPDAETPDNRPLFSTDPEAIARHKLSILAYRARQQASKHNIGMAVQHVG